LRERGEREKWHIWERVEAYLAALHRALRCLASPAESRLGPPPWVRRTEAAAVISGT
jgi:hypothetical protein